MNQCRKYRKMMSDMADGRIEGAAQPDFDEHLHSCSACTDEFQQIRDTVQHMRARIPREPDEHFWNGYWSSLSARMAAQEVAAKQPRWQTRIRDVFTQPFRVPMRLGLGGALLLVGIFIGREFTAAPVAETVEASDNRLIMQAAVSPRFEDHFQRYLERSTILLLSLKNLRPDCNIDNGLDLVHQQRISRELLRETAALKSELAERNESRLHDIVSQLEAIMVQISHLDADYRLCDVKPIQNNVKDLFCEVQSNIAMR